jgi:hypothetical protein
MFAFVFIAKPRRYEYETDTPSLIFMTRSTNKCKTKQMVINNDRYGTFPNSHDGIGVPPRRIIVMFAIPVVLEGGISPHAVFLAQSLLDGAIDFPYCQFSVSLCYISFTEEGGGIRK